MRMISPELTIEVVLSKEVYNSHTEQLCSTYPPGLKKIGKKSTAHSLLLKWGTLTSHH